MLSRIAIFFTLLLAGFTAAQAPTTDFNSSEITAIINKVSLTIRNQWCTSEISVCGDLCDGLTNTNGCDPMKLNATCTCKSNNSSPALQYYSGSLFSFICNQGQGDCNATNAGDLAAQEQCAQEYICGTLNASTANVAPTTTTSAAPSSTAASQTGSSTASASATAKSVAMKIGQDYGTGVFALMAAFVIGLFLLELLRAQVVSGIEVVRPTQKRCSFSTDLYFAGDSQPDNKPLQPTSDKAKQSKAKQPGDFQPTPNPLLLRSLDISHDDVKGGVSVAQLQYLWTMEELVDSRWPALEQEEVSEFGEETGVLCIILCIALGIANIFHLHLVIIFSIICLVSGLLLIFVEIPLLLRICPTSPKFDTFMRRFTTNYMRAAIYGVMSIVQWLSLIVLSTSLVAAAVVLLIAAVFYLIAAIKGQEFAGSKTLGGQGLAQMIV
ncbi:MAG: Golgi apparatus membrane protein tvp18 [Icmadophila ericetorum]|nr:Golgi apparatus membrane protein tvp18 [Icmadophila ericetorum]